MANFIDIQGTLINIDKMVKVDAIVTNDNDNKHGFRFRIHFERDWYWDARFNTQQEARAIRSLLMDKVKNG